MKFTAKPLRVVRREQDRAVRQHRRDLDRAAIIATDRASKDGQKAVQNAIRGAGLGRLAGAVGQTSSARKRNRGEPYGVIFARGGDESLAGGALESYSRGATITAQRKRWLAFPTKAVPRFVSLGGRRWRTTPELYSASGLVSSIGKLVFKPIGPNRAVLVIRRANVSPKTGRAKAPGPRKSRTLIPTRDVVAFVLIRVTTRAKRFDQVIIMQQYARRMPRYMAEALDEIRARRS